MKPKLVVIGDALLDRDVHGTVERLCPDAPAPVVDEDDRVERPGGAGLAAVLAAGRGADVTLVTALASDPAGALLARLLERSGVRVAGCPTGGATAEKTRVRVDGRSLLRLDRGRAGTLGQLSPDAGRAIDEAGVVLVADYGRGITQHPDVRALIAGAIGRGRPVVWDPHPRGAAPLPGVTLAVPNAREAARFDRAVAEVAASPLAIAAAQAQRLRAAWRCQAVAVTLGAGGAVASIGTGAPLVVPISDPVTSGDPCGAGDAFAVAAALGLGSGSVMSEAVAQAVDQAARFVAAGGAAHGHDQVGQPAASPVAATLVAAGGCFDVLHAGHVAMLEAARALGDRLVVLLNSDRSVRRLKGPGRPVQAASDRASVLRSLRCVDDVVVFDEDTPIDMLRRLRPDVFVKGGDYTSVDLPESAALATWGGVVVTAPYLAGRSTSQLIAHIVEVRDAS